MAYQWGWSYLLTHWDDPPGGQPVRENNSKKESTNPNAQMKKNIWNHHRSCSETIKNNSKKGSTDQRKMHNKCDLLWQSRSRVLGITCHLVLGGITDESLSVSEGHIGRSGSVALVVGDNFHSVIFPHTDATWLFTENHGRKGRSFKKNVENPCIWEKKRTKTKTKKKGTLKSVSKDCRWFQGQCQSPSSWPWWRLRNQNWIEVAKEVLVTTVSQLEPSCEQNQTSNPINSITRAL